MLRKRKNHFDVIVLGGGTIGLSAAYYAASAGQSVLLLEKKFFNDFGSSAGYSRFFRIMYSEQNMARLAEVSYALWKQIEKETGKKILEEVPLLFFGKKNIGETVEGDFQNTDKVMQDLGIPFKYLNNLQIEKMYKVFKTLPKDYCGLVQSNGAVTHVQNSLRAFYSLAQKAGVKLVDGVSATIKKTKPGVSSFEVKTEKGFFTSDNLILAPGAWTNDVVEPLGIKFKLKIWQMTLAYFKLKNKREYPLWYEFGESSDSQSGLYYGFPAREDPKRIKISADFTNDIFDCVSDCNRIPDRRILNLLSSHVEKRLKGVSSQPEKISTCLYTMSSDYKIILGLLPGYKNVSILTGESGRAFKYTPLFGRILAELIREGRTSYCLDSISIDRSGIFDRISSRG